MNALNLALRCSRLYLKGDVSAMGAADRLLLADHISQGIENYWRHAPDAVRAPQGDIGWALTVANGGIISLPANVEQFIRPPRVRTGPTAGWRWLSEWATDPWEPNTLGEPAYYRITSIMGDYPLGSASTGDEPHATYLQVYPAPSTTYELDFRARYAPPRVAGKHLAGLATTINLPIPENDCVNIIVPLCAVPLLAHPLVKSTLTVQAAGYYATEAMKRLSLHPPRRTATRGKCGTPLRY